MAPRLGMSSVVQAKVAGACAGQSFSGSSRRAGGSPTARAIPAPGRGAGEPHRGYRFSGVKSPHRLLSLAAGGSPWRRCRPPALPGPPAGQARRAQSRVSAEPRRHAPLRASGEIRPGPVGYEVSISASTMRSRRIEGTVVIEFLVDESGSVCRTAVLRATNPGFEEAALRAVARWIFKSGYKDGRRVRFRMSVPVIFRIDAS